MDSLVFRMFCLNANLPSRFSLNELFDAIKKRDDDRWDWLTIGWECFGDTKWHQTHQLWPQRPHNDGFETTFVLTTIERRVPHMQEDKHTHTHTHTHTLLCFFLCENTYYDTMHSFNLMKQLDFSKLRIHLAKLQAVHWMPNHRGSWLWDEQAATGY